MKVKILMSLLWGILALGCLSGCTANITNVIIDPSQTEQAETEEANEQYFDIHNTVWKGKYFLVFLGNDTFLLFDEEGRELFSDSVEWYGITGRAFLLDQGPYLEIEEGKLKVFGSDDSPTVYYEQTDRIPGTDPADGYVLENSTWHCVTNDKYTFYENGEVMLHNWYLGYTYEGSYEWDAQGKKGKIVMDNYTTDIELDESGYLCLTDIQGDPQQAGRGRFEKVTDFFALRGQEGEIQGTWNGTETSLSFDGKGGAVYQDAEGNKIPLDEFVHGYFFDGEKLTLIIGVDVRTGQPETVYGYMESDGKLNIEGVRYVRNGQE